MESLLSLKKLLKSDLPVRNRNLDVFRYVDNAYIIGCLVLSYIETLNPIISHFFIYYLLVSELYELNVFKLCSTFQLCPVPQALFVLEAFSAFIFRKSNTFLTLGSVNSTSMVCKLYTSVGNILDF